MLVSRMKYCSPMVFILSAVPASFLSPNVSQMSPRCFSDASEDEDYEAQITKLRLRRPDYKTEITRPRLRRIMQPGLQDLGREARPTLVDISQMI